MIRQMAWKNIFRYKRRSLITAAAIAIGVIFSILVDGLIFGLNQKSNENLINYETATAKIYATNYFTKRQSFPIEDLIENEQRQEIEKWLSQNYPQIYFTPRYTSSCEIIFYDAQKDLSGSLKAILVGIDPQKDQKVFQQFADLPQKKWLRAENSLVLGSWLAKDLAVQKGDLVTIQCKGRGGFLQTMDLTISEIIKTPNPIINANYLYLDLAYLNEMLELNNAVSEYSLQVNSYRQSQKLSPQMLKEFKKQFSKRKDKPKLEIYSWQILAADVIALTKSKSGATNLIIIFMFIVAAVGISNTILMSMMERKNEVAMLRALGYSTTYLKNLFTVEGMILGCLGTVAGLLISLPLNAYFVKYGIDYSASLGQATNIGFRVSAIIKSGWHWQAFCYIPLGALFVSALSARIPTRALLKKQIAEIFRKV